jgi:hypothetical protein
MGMKIWIGGQYENTGESAMVSEVIRVLRGALEPLADEYHILCNFNIPGYPRPAGQEYTSNLDMVILHHSQLVILELKNYKGTLSYGDGGTWYCDCDDGHRIEVKGGREGRTPHEQIRDYRNQMTSLIATNASRFLRKRGQPFDFRRFVSGVIVFPDSVLGNEDHAEFQGNFDRWLKILRLKGLAEGVCQFGGGRDVYLDDYEVVSLIDKVLGLKTAKMVGDCPMVAATPPPVNPAANGVKVVTVQVPVEVTRQVREEYGAIASIWNSEETDHDKAQQFVKLFKRFLWNKIRTTYKETAVKSVYSGIVNLFRGDPELLEHANRLRRFGNALANETVTASSVDVNESFKTLCLMVRKFYGQEIPETLAAACAKIVYRDSARFERRNTTRLSILVEVKHVDQQASMLTCVDVGSPEEKELKVLYGGGTADFSDLHTYVKPGDRLCLVTPMEVNGVLKASEIVLEPDYLVSPQRIGGAFEFAKPEVYFWLSLFEDEAKKLRRVTGNGPLTMEQFQLRGEYANACLADYSVGDVRDARARMSGFFRANSIAMTSAMKAAEDIWARDCSAQDANLKRFIGETIPREHHVPPGTWQIEAPLYSPVYGLSARADAISYGADGHSATVLELKSGKWNTFQGDSPQIGHAVQPIFYGDLLYFSLGIRRDAVNQLLCYSTTIPRDQWNPQKEGKLFTRAELEHVMPGGTIGRAMRTFARVRNGIVATGALVRSGGFRAVVDALLPEDFRPEGMNDRFWTNYKKPEIADLLSPLQNADELAKRYFHRQLVFVAEEEYQARLGEKGADIGRGGSASCWRLSLAERQRAGLRLSELTVLRAVRDDLGRVVSIELDTSAHRLNKGCSIRAGDSVCLYKSTKADDNITNAVVFAANVEELNTRSIVLSLANPQPASLVGLAPGAVFVVEPAPSSYMSSSYSGLRYFFSGDTRRQRLVLNDVRPAIDPGAKLPMSEREFARRYPSISDVIARAWRAKDWFLLWGPPGTGKTSTAMCALVDLAMATPGMRILLLAYTYRATDEICKMLEARLKVAGQTNDVYLRLGNPLKCDPTLRGRMASKMGFATRRAVLDYTNSVRIVVGTVASVAPHNPVFGLFEHFDMAVVDEASQLLDTHILPLFCAKNLTDGTPLVGKFVFIGDDRQLPAVVKQNAKTSKIDDDMLRKHGILDCRHSFFQRLRAIAGGRDADPSLCGLLDTQYRMHPTIAGFCNRFFYDDRLVNGDKPHQTSDLPPPPDDADSFERYVLSTRLGFFPVVNPARDLDAKMNEAESELCAKVVATLLKRDACIDDAGARPYKAGEIGVIVPFRNQIANVREMLVQKLGEGLDDGILVDTVERFQGAERPVIVFSTVIQNLYQSDMLSAKRYDEDDDDGDEDNIEIDRKLNVAVTRAKERFYIVGNESVLRGLHAYGDLLEWISTRTGFFDADVVF